MNVLGVASTIDNDLFGTDVSIGTTTALDTAMEAIDRLRVTAASHRRAFLVEVMGRHSGYLAAVVAIAGGAEAIVVPELDMPPEAIAQQLQASRDRGKSHAIVVVAEGARTASMRCRTISMIIGSNWASTCESPGSGMYSAAEPQACMTACSRLASAVPRWNASPRNIGVLVGLRTVRLRYASEPKSPVARRRWICNCWSWRRGWPLEMKIAAIKRQR